MLYGYYLYVVKLKGKLFIIYNVVVHLLSSLDPSVKGQH